MSSHLAIEVLSSYLDEEVTPKQLRLVEEHLDECADCRRTLDGLRSVSESVRRLESVAPPPTLGMATEQRLRIAALEESRGLDIERSLGQWLKQPVLAPVFAVVLALGAILYLFSYGLAQRDQRTTRVVVASLPSEEADAVERIEPSDAPATSEANERRLEVSDVQANLEVVEPSGARQGEILADAALRPTKQVESKRTVEPAAEVQVGRARRSPAAREMRAAGALAATEGASLRTVAGRTFIRTDGVWVERGLEGESAETVLEQGEAAEAGLGAFAELGRVRLLWKERVTEVVYREAAGRQRRQPDE